MRAGISGVLVELDHQVGEHVDTGTTLAKVVQPDQLKAESEDCRDAGAGHSDWAAGGDRYA